ncbi:MAG: undecaprenyldiphospho-muramoylpentapeptide beta-N-acetylglucosaminyltransferase [Candidatus Limiplasma sp.]|nr:undecaprenyldiphospho-muramoylpentapeptide beta-N-acetylglucosaminyltransferase [Candidatus Limiplasma sp.]
MKRIVLTGGGTAGHVTPHMSLIPRLREAGYDIHYIGTERGIEHELIGRIPDVTYHVVRSGKLRRYFSLQNFTDPFRVLHGAWTSVRLMRTLRPDVCFSKGGFVSVPVVVGAWLAHVPTVCHESDLTPGLANRISAVFVDKVATTFAECAEALGLKAVMTGTPLRPSLFQGSREKGLALAGLTGTKPVLLMTGGSLGAQSVNACLRACLPALLPHMEVLHLCGRGNLDPTLTGVPGYGQLEFLGDEMPDALAAADLVLSRAGSNTLSELLALQKPMLLVPYPQGASRGDQIENAQSFARQGLARVLPQEQMNPDTLTAALLALLAERDTLRKTLADYPVKDGTDAVLALIEAVQRRA